MNFTSFSGSAACPAGAAVSGWYNLPGIPVKKGEKGGPATWTGLQVFCRKTSLLAACAQPEKSHCEVGHVVNAFSYSGNQFKLGCCRLQKPMGTKLTPDPRKARLYEGFEGYYCPAAMGSTGMAVYRKSRIGPLGEPGTSTDLNWTLSWEKFDGTWVLRHALEKYASVESDAVSPLEIEANAKFSATKIEALLSEAAKPKVQSPFPKKKPTYPKLIQFRPVQPDYKAYCNPAFLQNPSLFKGSISDTNPCYHTFHAELVKARESHCCAPVTKFPGFGHGPLVMSCGSWFDHRRGNGAELCKCCAGCVGERHHREVLLVLCRPWKGTAVSLQHGRVLHGQSEGRIGERDEEAPGLPSVCARHVKSLRLASEDKYR
ncbi:NEK5 [Symbiodinium necroappetens]|uniref:NEK5 protein n=1 Tax=Symbiodinium necroappetens TaxID=1628268 RepID=A0A813CFG4_9DINO|nr:NEK5 [Symbiodinium necroappetens]